MHLAKLTTIFSRHPEDLYESQTVTSIVPDVYCPAYKHILFHPQFLLIPSHNSLLFNSNHMGLHLSIHDSLLFTYHLLLLQSNFEFSFHRILYYFFPKISKLPTMPDLPS